MAARTGSGPCCAPDRLAGWRLSRAGAQRDGQLTRGGLSVVKLDGVRPGRRKAHGELVPRRRARVVVGADHPVDGEGAGRRRVVQRPLPRIGRLVPLAVQAHREHPAVVGVEVEDDGAGLDHGELGREHRLELLDRRAGRAGLVAVALHGLRQAGAIGLGDDVRHGPRELVHAGVVRAGDLRVGRRVEVDGRELLRE